MEKKLKHVLDVLNANCGDGLKENVLRRMWPDDFGNREETIPRVAEAAFAAAKLAEPNIPNPRKEKHNGRVPIPVPDSIKEAIKKPVKQQLKEDVEAAAETIRAELPKELYTMKEATQILGVTALTVRNRAEHLGFLFNFKKIGGKIMITKEQLKQLEDFPGARK